MGFGATRVCKACVRVVLFLCCLPNNIVRARPHGLLLSLLLFLAVLLSTRSTRYSPHSPYSPYSPLLALLAAVQARHPPRQHAATGGRHVLRGVHGLHGLGDVEGAKGWGGPAATNAGFSAQAHELAQGAHRGQVLQQNTTPQGRVTQRSNAVSKQTQQTSTAKQLNPWGALLINSLTDQQANKHTGQQANWPTGNLVTG